MSISRILPNLFNHHVEVVLRLEQSLLICHCSNVMGRRIDMFLMTIVKYVKVLHDHKVLLSYYRGRDVLVWEFIIEHVFESKSFNH